MDCARPQATLHRAIEMDEATEPIRQHSVLVEASLFTLEPESPEERLRRIEVIAGEDGRKPLLDGGDRLAGLKLDRVLQLAQAIEFLLRELLLVVLRFSKIFLRVLDLLPE